jgi:hypothetical protein
MSRKAALRSEISLDFASIENRLRANQRDTDGEPIADLGFHFGAWNGKEASFSATIGAWNRIVANAVVLNLGGDDELSASAYRALVEAVIEVFDPDHAVVTSHHLLELVEAKHPWEAGLFTYERGCEIEEHPVAEKA